MSIVVNGSSLPGIPWEPRPDGSNDIVWRYSANPTGGMDEGTMSEHNGDVLFLCPQPFFQWRGSPIRVGFDVQALAELGYGVDLLVLPVGEEREVPGVRVCRVGNPLRVKNVPIGPSPIKAFFDLLILCRALRMLRHKRYRVIHGVEEAGAIGALLAKRVGCKLVYEKHSDPASHKKGALRNLVLAAYARVERFTARRADAVIGTGSGLVKQIAPFAKSQPHHIPDIPSSLAPVDPQAAARIRAELCACPSDRLVTYVGSFAVYQGIDLMFEAIPRVVAGFPSARFVIVGGSPAQIAERRAVLERRGVANRVMFIGKVPPDELPNYLAASDVLLSPRLSGVNTPLKLLDYLKAERAVLATDTEANRLILDDSMAVLVSPEVEAFAEGALRLLGDDSLRERLAARGRKLIATTYNFAEFKRRLGECYAGVVEEEQDSA